MRGIKKNDFFLVESSFSSHPPLPCGERVGVRGACFGIVAPSFIEGGFILKDNNRPTWFQKIFFILVKEGKTFEVRA